MHLSAADAGAAAAEARAGRLVLVHLDADRRTGGGGCPDGIRWPRRRRGSRRPRPALGCRCVGEQCLTRPPQKGISGPSSPRRGHLDPACPPIGKAWKPRWNAPKTDSSTTAPTSRVGSTTGSITGVRPAGSTRRSTTARSRCSAAASDIIPMRAAVFAASTENGQLKSVSSASASSNRACTSMRTSSTSRASASARACGANSGAATIARTGPHRGSRSACSR